MTSVQRQPRALARAAGVPVLLCPGTAQTPLAEATLGQCSVCRSAVWISTVMRPVVDAGDLRAVCDGCMTWAACRGVTLGPTREESQAATGMDDAQWAALHTGILARIEGAR